MSIEEKIKNAKESHLFDELSEKEKFEAILEAKLKVRLIAELEKIKAEIQAEQITDGQVYNGEYFSDDALNINYGISICLDILDKYISELKGKNNG